jgi:folate-binding protein YgfZ
LNRHEQARELHMTVTSTVIVPASQLTEYLRLRGAVFHGARAIHFGDLAAERASLICGTTLHALGDQGLLQVAGADAASFLHGQLSSDVRELAQQSAQLSSYCTPQGRVLATPLVWRTSDAYLLQLPYELLPDMQVRLQKFVLRARASLADVSARLTLIGVGGPGAAQTIADAFGEAPAMGFGFVHREGSMVLRLNDELFVAAVEAAGAPSAWDRLTQSARPVGTAGWDWRLIQAGIPIVTAATQAQFVPQMLNLERLGAVNFSKGCYPGQEIVARTQYRGEVKRRLFRLHADAPTAVPATGIFAPELAQAVGAIVNAAPAPAGGCDLLAVLVLDSAARTDLRLGTPAGPALSAAQPA